MGVYRFLLAALVASSHLGLQLAGYNQGVVAVISFMLLSGYVMTKLVDKYYAEPKTIPIFYVDRLARLLPQFLFYSITILTLLSFAGLGAAPLPWMNFSTCSTPLLVMNFSLFGNNFYWIFEQCMLIPASWSLGLEGFFYLAVPWLLLGAAHMARLILVILSICVFLLAYAGKLDSDIYGYRLLIGNLHIFLAGAALARPGLLPPRFPALVFVGAAILMAGAQADAAIYARPLLKEVLLGLLIGLPVLAVLRRYRFSALDEYMGNLSYGVFLNHVLCRWCAERYLGVREWDPVHVVALLAAATLLSLASYYGIERAALAWRRALRQTSTRASDPPGSQPGAAQAAFIPDRAAG